MKVRGDSVAEEKVSNADGGVGVVELALDSSAPGNGGKGDNGGLLRADFEERLVPGIAGRAVVGGGCGDGD